MAVGGTLLDYWTIRQVTGCSKNAAKKVWPAIEVIMREPDRTDRKSERDDRRRVKDEHEPDEKRGSEAQASDLEDVFRDGKDSWLRRAVLACFADRTITVISAGMKRSLQIG